MVEDLLLCGAPSGPESCLFFSKYVFILGFWPIQDNFQRDFAQMILEGASYYTNSITTSITKMLTHVM